MMILMVWVEAVAVEGGELIGDRILIAKPRSSVALKASSHHSSSFLSWHDCAPITTFISLILLS
jgi:hypothetical protein